MENKPTIKHYKIPLDVLMDILRILFGNKIKHKIIGIRERENMIILQAQFQITDNNISAEENIEGILKDYSEYMKGILGDQTLFMDEEDENQ